MSILKLFGLEGRGRAPGPPSEPETVRKIVDALERMEPEQARYVAGFAYVLSRVAHADLDISAEETRAMERIVVERAGLPEEQAIIVVQIAKTQSLLFGGTDDYVVTREFNRIATQAQKRALLDCLFAVSAADRDVSMSEDGEIRRIAGELGLTHEDFIAARSAFREHLAVLKPR